MSLGQNRFSVQLVAASLMGVACLLTAGCGGGDNPPPVAQQPIAPTPVPLTPTTTTVVPVPSTPVTAPVPATPVTTTIVITIPGGLAQPPPPTVTPVPPPTQPLPPFDPNRPPWWARPRGGSVTIIRISDGEIEIINRRRGGWDGWRRGPNGWFNPDTGQWIPRGAQGVPATLPTTTETVPLPLTEPVTTTAPK